MGLNQKKGKILRSNKETIKNSSQKVYVICDDDLTSYSVCVVCGAKLPTESGSMICKECSQKQLNSHVKK